MKNSLRIAVLSLALLPLQLRAQPVPPPPLVQAENTFAVDLYGKLSQTHGNLFFSPYSIAATLEMVYFGAKGATADQIARTLHLNLLASPNDTSILQTALFNAAQAQKLFAEGDTNGFSLHSANALWGDKSFQFNPDFISGIKAGFGGDLEPVNFKHPIRASARINEWVAAQTKGKIQNLIAPEMLADDPAMVLTNAVYFKAAWLSFFDPSETTQATFHTASGRDVIASMMNIAPKLGLTQADGIKLLCIPYQADATMIIILPDNRNNMPAIEAGLTTLKLDAWLASIQYVPVILSMPKFQASDEFQLKNILMSLGINTAFNQKEADFTGIASDPNRPIYLDAVVQKSYINVDEKGTEAAAATAALMGVSAGIEAPPPPPVEFIADHPFIYLIRANQNGAILFMGRVDDPSQQG
jgi:serpin B